MSESMNFKEKTYQMIYEEFSTVLDRIEEVKSGLPEATDTAIQRLDQATKGAIQCLDDNSETSLKGINNSFSSLSADMYRQNDDLRDIHEEFMIDVERHIRQCEERLYSPLQSYIEVLSDTERVTNLIMDEIDRYASETTQRLGAKVQVEASYAVIAAGRAAIEAEVMPVIRDIKDDLYTSMDDLNNLVVESRTSLSGSLTDLQGTANAATQALSERITKLLTKSNLKLGAIAASAVFLIGLALGSTVSSWTLHRYAQHQEAPAESATIEADSVPLPDEPPPAE